MADLPTTSPAGAGPDSSPASPADGEAGGVPTVATTLTIPPSAASELPGDPEGGEWELLIGQLRDWFASGQARAAWVQVRTPALVLAALIATLMVLRIYAALIQAMDSLPLLPGLLELVGVIWVVRNGVPRLLRRGDREQLAEGLRQRWRRFRAR